MVRIGGVETHEHAFDELALAADIAHEPDIRRLHEQDAVLEKLETGGAVETVEPHGAFVGAAILVGVFEDEDLVAVLGEWRALGVVGPDGDPQAALGVEGHLHRLREFGKLLLAREEIHLQSGRDGHL